MALLITVLTAGNFPSVFKDNESLRSHKTVKIKVFLIFLACWCKDLDSKPSQTRIRTNNNGVPGPDVHIYTQDVNVALVRTSS